MDKLDVDRLRSELKEYNRTLDTHHSRLRHDYAEVERLFGGLFAVYGGQRAQELEGQWRQTAEWFVDYLNAISRLRGHLEERITSLDHL
jgi:hypothetical protein